jgi:hypothetical protein
VIIRRRDNIPLYCMLFGMCTGITAAGALLLLEDWLHDAGRSQAGSDLLVLGLGATVFVTLQVVAVEFFERKKRS